MPTLSQFAKSNKLYRAVITKLDELCGPLGTPGNEKMADLNAALSKGHPSKFFTETEVKEVADLLAQRTAAEAALDFPSRRAR
jgi:hypothetical protein